MVATVGNLVAEVAAVSESSAVTAVGEPAAIVVAVVEWEGPSQWLWQ
jgi:hypothetical protein